MECLPHPQDRGGGVLRAEASRGRPQAGGQPQRAAPRRPDPAKRLAGSAVLMFIIAEK